jgi:probable rRNA maturation factor
VARVVDQQTTIRRAGAACKRAAEAVLAKRPVTVAIVDDATIARLHEQFLDVAGPTDVLSFPSGEIVVSADTALREAKRRGIPPLHELQLYVVHGALHLAGYDDRSPAQQRRMRAAERRVLEKLGLGDVFGARPKEEERRRRPRRAGRPRRKSRGRRPKR